MDIDESNLIGWVNSYLMKNNLFFVPFESDQNNNRYKFLGTNMIIQKNKDFDFVYNYYKVFNDKNKLVNCDYKILKSILSKLDKNFDNYEDKYLKYAKDKSQQVFRTKKIDFGFLPFFESLVEYKDYILFNDVIHVVSNDGDACNENGIFIPMLQKFNYDNTLIFIAIKKEKIHDMFKDRILDKDTFFIRKFKEINLLEDEDLEDVASQINFLDGENVIIFFKHILKYKNMVRTITKDEIPDWLKQCISLNDTIYYTDSDNEEKI
jgi:hypothetical protein